MNASKKPLYFGATKCIIKVYNAFLPKKKKKKGYNAFIKKRAIMQFLKVRVIMQKYHITEAVYKIYPFVEGIFSHIINLKVKLLPLQQVASIA